MLLGIRPLSKQHLPLFSFIRYLQLLRWQAIFASVIPGEAMRGSIGQMVQFPSWLGKNSTTGKNDRLLQELRSHMRLRSISQSEIINKISVGIGFDFGLDWAFAELVLTVQAIQIPL